VAEDEKENIEDKKEQSDADVDTVETKNHEKSEG
jgi:hypothetical protein